MWPWSSSLLSDTLVRLSRPPPPAAQLPPKPPTPQPRPAQPRLGMIGISLSLRRVFPDRYPLGDHLAPTSTPSTGSATCSIDHQDL